MPRKLVPQRFVSATFANDRPAARFAEAWRAITADDRLRQRLELPGVLLDDYFRHRRRGPLGGIITEASRVAEWCETFVVVAPHDVAARAQALLRATTHPHFNLLAHGDRGGRPRIVFLEPTLDHDAIRAVVDLLHDDGSAVPHQRWAIAVVAGRNEAEQAAIRETAGPLLALLEESAVPRCFLFADDETAGVLPTPTTPLAALGDAMHFDGPSLFVAGVAGADIVSLLKGAIWFYETTRAALAEEHAAVRLADALSHEGCEIVAWHHALAAAAHFLELAEQGRGGERRFSLVRAYEFHGYQQLLTDHRRPRLHLFSDAIRRDRLDAPPATTEAAPLTHVATPDSLVAACKKVRSAENAAGQTSTELRLTRLNDQALGELCAWLATARLILDTTH